MRGIRVRGRATGCALRLRRVWTTAGLIAAIGTEAFIHLPCSRRAVQGRSLRSAASRTNLSPTFRERNCRPRPRALAWNLGDRKGLPRSAPSAAQQSVDGGVQLPSADCVEEYAPFLAEAIRQHLDEEWMEQACHKEIGNEVAKIFRAAVTGGTVDLTSLVLDIGAGLEKVDMEEAFVGPWDIANLTSDFLMQKMGAETSGCSTIAPSTSLRVRDMNSATAAAEGGGSFRFTTDEVQRVLENLTTDLSRYRFLKDFMNENLDWAVVNTVMAVYQGYTPQGSPEVAGAVRHVWRRSFPGPSPPDLRTSAGVVEALEADYPDDPDLIDGLEVIVETVYGGEATKIDSGDPDNGIPANEAFVLRSTICKWLYLMGFLNDDIKRAPDDLQDIADLVSGRAKLRHS